MFAWKDFDFTVGMPHMVPERLSEVELLKWCGAYQWESIADMVGVSSAGIANEDGERLYASFIDIELDLGARPDAAGGGGHGLHLFDEGTRVHLRNGTRLYAGNFVEGLFVLDTSRLDEGPLAAEVGAIAGRDDLARLGLPWVAMDNAFVARHGGENDRLKVFTPAGLEGRTVPETDNQPPGIAEHARVQATGEIAPPWTETDWRPLPVRDEAPVTYEIVPESDLNGAGLLYFARFVAMMDYGVRVFLGRSLALPVSHHLLQFLTTTRRRIFYFANAQPWDAVTVRVRPRVRLGDPAAGSNRHRVPLELALRVDLHRVSDRVLMASSLVRKALVVPARRKAVLAEAERFARWVENGT